MPNKDPAIHRQQAKEYYRRHREEICTKLRNSSPEKKAKMALTKRQYTKKNHDKITAYRQTTQRRFGNAKSIAKKRELAFELTFEVYAELISHPCYYCANKLGRSLTGGGLDRIDNSKGYVTDNCLSCCTICNRIRNDFLTVEETKKVISLILNLRGFNEGY